MLDGTLQKDPRGFYTTDAHPSDVTLLWGSSDNTAEQLMLPKWVMAAGVVGLVGLGFIIGRQKKRK